MPDTTLPIPIPQPPNIPWWQSGVIRGLAVSLVAKILAVAHVSAAFPSASDVVDIALDAIQFGGLLWAGFKRSRPALPNITATQGKADAANAAAASLLVVPINPPAPGVTSNAAVPLKPMDSVCTAIGIDPKP